MLEFRKTLIALSCLSVSLTTATIGHAAEPEVSVPNYEDLYFGIGMGLSQIDPDLAGTGYQTNDDGDTAGKLFVGAEVGPRLSVEASINSLGTVGLSPNGKVSYDAYSVEGLLYVINGPAYQGHNLGKDFSLYGRFGLSHVATDTIGPSLDKGFQLAFGIGVEQYLRNGFTARGEWQTLSNDVSLWSISLVRRFNHRRQAENLGPTLRLPGSSAPQTKPTDFYQPQKAKAPIKNYADQAYPEPSDRGPNKTLYLHDTQQHETTRAQNTQRQERPIAPVFIAQQASTPKPQHQAFTPPVERQHAINNKGDLDNDGVINYEDICSQSPQNFAISRNGCLIDASSNPVAFANGSDQLTPKAKTWLNHVAIELQQNPQLEFEVQAYTDNVGSSLSNLQLSSHRAHQVVNYLEKKNINRARMLPIGQGEISPIADNSTEIGRAKNRRVKFILLK